MKKLMFAAAALAAGVAFAEEKAPAVTSANVVGYSQVTIPAQTLTMIGVQFGDVNGTDAIDVQDLFPDPLGQGLTGATAAGSADQLMYWDPSVQGSYVYLYLCKNTATTSAAKLRHNKWLLKTKIDDTSWGTAASVPSPKKLTSGMGLWLNRKNSTEPITLTMAGGVVKAEEGRSITVREGLTMISGGFTTGWAPNPDTAGVGPAVDWLSKGCIGATAAGSADQLMFWDPSVQGSYIYLYLCKNTATTSAAKLRHNKWLLKTKIDDTSWGTAASVPSPKVIPMGRGVWYNRKSGAGSLTFTMEQPYSL